MSGAGGSGERDPYQSYEQRSYPSYYDPNHPIEANQPIHQGYDMSSQVPQANTLNPGLFSCLKEKRGLMLYRIRPIYPP